MGDERRSVEERGDRPQRWRVLVADLTDAALSLRAKPVRTLALVVGAPLGVASAVTTVGLTESQKAQIDLMFDAQRSRFMIFEPGSEARQGFSALVEERSSVLAELEPVGEVGEK
jgi:putative ABC transport system permease protein